MTSLYFLGNYDVIDDNEIMMIYDVVGYCGRFVKQYLMPCFDFLCSDADCMTYFRLTSRILLSIT